jgi:hypothetical protein
LHNGRGENQQEYSFWILLGLQISDPKKMLIGNGNQYRYILVKSINESPKAYIKKLLKDAYENSLAKVKDEKQIVNGLTITKSLSTAKRTIKPKALKKPAKKTVKKKK